MAEGIFSGIMGDDDGSVKALGAIWGTRGDKRRTNGDPRFTRALVWIGVLDRLGVPDMKELLADVCEARAGEMGWDTAQLIRALAATKGRNLVSPAPEPHPEAE